MAGGKGLSGKGLAGIGGGGRSAADKGITAANERTTTAPERVTRARVGAGLDGSDARDGPGEARLSGGGHAGLSGEAWLSGGVGLGTGKRRLSVARPLAGQWRQSGVLPPRQLAAPECGAFH